MSRIALVLLVLTLAAGAGSVAVPTPDDARSQEAPAPAAGVPTPSGGEPLVLSKGWQFRPDPSDVGKRQKWFNGEGTEGWNDVQVPHVFDPTPPERLYEGTLGWYRIRFTAPESGSHVIKFGSVRRIGGVWLNGVKLGVVQDPYVSVQLPARSLQHGRENLLVVRVDNRRPADLREGWWNWGGIVRPVALVRTPEVGLFETSLLPVVECKADGVGPCEAKVRLDALLFNYRKVATQPIVTVTIKSPSGRVTTAQRRFSAAPGGAEKRIRLGFRVPQPELWSPKTPQRYEATVVVRDDEGLKHEEKLKFGLRQVTVENGLLHLNGKRLHLRGAAIQEDLPGRGPALKDADVEQIVSDLKALNANVTRAHYLLHPKLLERFDEEGILVWSQAAVYHADRALVDPRGRSKALRTVYLTVIEARKHPSVITHSVANELSPEPDRHLRTKDFLVKAAAMTRRLDPSVPVSLDLLTYPNIPHQRTYEVFDLLGLNSYYGWYEGKPGIRSTADLGDLAPYLKTMRRKYRRHAMAITEFGAEATFKGPRNVKETYAFQADYIRKTLDIVDRHEWLSGSIYWTAREFYVKPDWDGGANRRVPRDAIHNKGLLTYHGRPKQAWEVVRSRFARAAAAGR